MDLPKTKSDFPWWAQPCAILISWHMIWHHHLRQAKFIKQNILKNSWDKLIILTIWFIVHRLSAITMWWKGSMYSSGVVVGGLPQLWLSLRFTFLLLNSSPHFTLLINVATFSVWIYLVARTCFCNYFIIPRCKCWPFVKWIPTRHIWSLLWIVSLSGNK